MSGKSGEYQGIKLPGSLLNELGNNKDESIHQPLLKRGRISQATRKENRKLERQKKRGKKGEVRKKNERKVEDSESENSEDDFDGFDDFDSESDESDVETKKKVGMSAADTMAALKAAKEKKVGMSAADTMTALKAAKEKKVGKSAADTMAALKAAKEKKTEMSAADTMAALKAAKEKKTEMSAADTMAALKAAKEKKTEMSAADTMAALKAAKEKKTEMSATDTMAALKAAKKKKTEMSAADTMAALKAAKEKKNVLSAIPAKSKPESAKRKSQDDPHGKKLKKQKPERFISEHDKYLMAQDEEAIDFYAKKLGLKSLKLKSKDSIDDGFDDILGGLDFDRFASGDETEDSEEESESDHEDNEAPEHEEPEHKESEPEEPPKPKENPYVAPVAGKYVPPSKRKLLAQPSESEEMTHLRRQIKGLINRLTESNIGSIINEIENIYLRNARSHVNTVITNIIIESTAMQGTLIESFLIIHAAFVTALYRTMGVEFGAHFVQNLVEHFEKYLSQNTGKEASNLLSLLSEIYTFQLISCKLVYDFIRLFLQDINEINTEFLLKIIRNSGPQLRSDDPSSLKEIIYLLQTAVSKAEPTTINSRTKFLIESITALKNNRQKIANETSIASTQRMKKFLGTISGITNEPLHVSLDDIHSIESKGKWWIVGAAYNNTTTAQKPDVDIDAMNDILDTAEPNWMELARKQRMNTDVRKAVFVALMSSEDYIDSCERLQKLRLKSKQEREIPKVILHCCSNEEVYNPFYSLVAGKLCAQHSIKKTFQFCLWDFLSELQGDEDSDEDDDGFEKLVKNSQTNEKDVLTKINHLARFYAGLVARGDMNLDILKAIDFLTAVTEVKLFLEVFFVMFFEIIGKNAEKGGSNKTKKNGFGNAMFGIKRDEKELAQMLIKTKDQTVLRGIQYFQRYIPNSTVLPVKQKQKDRVIWGSSIMNDLIEGLLN